MQSRMVNLQSSRATLKERNFIKQIKAPIYSFCRGENVRALSNLEEKDKHNISKEDFHHG